MDTGRKLTISAAVIVLICFFLPWVQLSCGGSHDTSTGIDLARDGERILWLIPVLMLAIILLGLGAFTRGQTLQQKLFSLMTFLCGLATIYLMNKERLRFSDRDGLLEVRFTGWFWLGLLSAIAISAIGIAGILRRSRAPPTSLRSAPIQYTGPLHLYDPGTIRNQNEYVCPVNQTPLDAIL